MATSFGVTVYDVDAYAPPAPPARNEVLLPLPPLPAPHASTVTTVPATIFVAVQVWLLLDVVVSVVVAKDSPFRDIYRKGAEGLATIDIATGSACAIVVLNDHPTGTNTACIGEHCGTGCGL